jgi:superoxide dismutase, Cu-Zn family
LKPVESRALAGTSRVVLACYGITIPGVSIMRQILSLGFVALLMTSVAASAQEAKVDINAITADGVGAPIGALTLSDSAGGLMVSGQLQGLKPGAHGFHIHEKPDCGAAEKDGKMTAGEAAGGHFDPDATKSHKGPGGDGHLGDLVAVEAADTGIADVTSTAPRLKLDMLRGRALMIHEGGDNYTDEPANGGGGARIACGIVK